MKRNLTCSNYFIILEIKIFKRAHQMLMFRLAQTSHFGLWDIIPLPPPKSQLVFHVYYVKYEGCSNMNASSFITFFTYMLRQNIIPFWKELFVAIKMAPNIKKHSLYFSSYRSLYKGNSSILKFF